MRLRGDKGIANSCAEVENIQANLGKVLDTSMAKLKTRFCEVRLLHSGFKKYVLD